jgi:hypothetical protein
MAHSLNVAAKHVLEALRPTPRRVLAKKNSRAAKSDNVDQDEDESESDEEEDDGSDEEDVVEFQPGDLLGKVHAFVTQACLHFSQRLLPCCF